jgi:aspartate racemase
MVVVAAQAVEAAMKTIGLLGGMSWESTVLYYQIVNRTVAERLGGLHSAKVLLSSVDFDEIEKLQHAGQWEQAGTVLAREARRLELAGANFLVICTNTMHKVAPQVEAAISIPLLHIADPTAAAIARAGVKTVGLLGTRFTMEQEFYRGRLEREHGLEVLVPPAPDITTVHNVIYDELCRGRVMDASRAQFRRVIGGLVARGAQGIILGCTEITMLVGAKDSPVPLFDTTELHARAAARRAVDDSSAGSL